MAVGVRGIAREMLRIFRRKAVGDPDPQETLLKKKGRDCSLTIGLICDREPDTVGLREGACVRKTRG